MSANIGADSDSELRSQVRAITQYDDSDISTEDMKSQVSIAKLRLKNKTDVDVTDVDPFYSDDGLTQALLFTTCILAKGTVENIALDRWNVGDVMIEAYEAGSSNDQQFQHWAELVNEGLQASEISTAGPLPNVTNSFP